MLILRAIAAKFTQHNAQIELGSICAFCALGTCVHVRGCNQCECRHRNQRVRLQRARACTHAHTRARAQCEWGLTLEAPRVAEGFWREGIKPPFLQLGGLEERCKLPQRGPGQSPGKLW